MKLKRLTNDTPNENVINFLKKNYLTSKKTSFGILIKGDWGCGKTHLIKQIQESYNKTKEVEFIYLSVYGLNSIEQVFDRLYELTHPIITSKAFKLFCKLLKNSIAASTKGAINLKDEQSGKEHTSDITLSLPISAFENNFTKNIKFNKIFIVDDIERSSIPVIEIFGYFSNFINDNNAKVIFICNEEHLLSSFGENEKTAYTSQKEKIIGMEFKIQPNKEAAIDYFIKDYGLKYYEPFLRDNILNIMSLTDCNNLRTIQQVLYYLNIIYEEIKDYTIVDEIYNNFTIYFIVTFIAKAKGKILNPNIQEFYKTIKEFHTNIVNYNLTSKFEILDASQIPFLELFPNMLFNGDFDKKKLIDEYTNITNPKDDKTKYLGTMKYQWRSFDKNQFSKYYKELKKQLEKGKFRTYTELWDYSELFLTLIDKQVIPDTQAELEKSILDYIDKYFDKIKADVLPDEYNDYMFYDNGDTTEVSILNKSKVIVDKIFESSNAKIKLNDKTRIINALSNINTDYKLIISHLEEYCNPDFPLSLSALSDFISAKDLFSKIKNISVDKQKQIYDAFAKGLNALKQDYNQAPNTIFNKDINLLIDLSDCYKQEYSNTELFNPEILNKQSFIERYSKLYAFLTLDEDSK